MELPSALQELGSYRAFIVCRLDAKPKGGTNKVPVDPTAGYEIDPHDFTNLITASEAAAHVERLGPRYRVGFVFIPGHNFFGIDLDHCLTDGAWHQNALSILSWFPGAAVEVSVSGDGLHIFGRHDGTLASHRKKTSKAIKAALGFGAELYTELRFFCLGSNMQGSFLSDHSVNLKSFADIYFKPQPGDTIENEDWTDEPVASWRGPQDDDVLIDRMLKARLGAAVIFAGKASFEDLWTRNAQALRAAFPKGTGEYDESSADQALANRLAWWTGNDCERMLRLMWRSNLARDKWNRDDYLHRTILKACATQTEWYKERAPIEPLATAGVVPPTTGEQPTHSLTQQTAPAQSVDGNDEAVQIAPVGGFLFLDQQLQYFAGCTYVEDCNMVITPDLKLLNQAQFNARYAGHKFVTEADGSKPTTKAWDAFVLSTIYRFPKVRSTGFYPLKPPGAIIDIEGDKVVNSWKPLNLKHVEGDVTLFLEHLAKLYPVEHDRNVLLNYMRAVVQFPGVKFRWAPFIQGVEGNGKSFFSHVLEHAVGRSYTHWPKAKELDSKFNDAFYGKLLICVEDVYVSEDRNGMWETLKPMITNERLEIEGKGIAKITRDVCFNFILNSNHKDGLRKTKNDRRIAPLFSAQQDLAHLRRDGIDERYTSRLYNWARNQGGYSAIAYYLQHSKIDEGLNPVTADRAPETSSTQAAIDAGRGSVEQAIMEQIEMQAQGFAGDWVSSYHLSNMLQRLRKEGISPRKRNEILTDLGYEPHPMLKNGLSTTYIPGEGRPYLWVKVGHLCSNLTSPASIAKAYQEAQAKALLSAAERVAMPAFGKE